MAFRQIFSFHHYVVWKSKETTYAGATGSEMKAFLSMQTPEAIWSPKMLYINRIGGADEKVFPGHHENVWWCLKVEHIFSGALVFKLQLLACKFKSVEAHYRLEILSTVFEGVQTFKTSEGIMIGWQTRLPTAMVTPPQVKIYVFETDLFKRETLHQDYNTIPDGNSYQINWTVHNFNKTSFRKGEMLFTEFFEIPNKCKGLAWRLLMYPAGRHQPEETLSGAMAVNEEEKLVILLQQVLPGCHEEQCICHLCASEQHYEPPNFARKAWDTLEDCCPKRKKKQKHPQASKSHSTKHKMKVWSCCGQEEVEMRSSNQRSALYHIDNAQYFRGGRCTIETTAVNVQKMKKIGLSENEYPYWSVDRVEFGPGLHGAAAVMLFSDYNVCIAQRPNKEKKKSLEVSLEMIVRLQFIE